MTPEQKLIQGFTVCRFCSEKIKFQTVPIIGEPDAIRLARFTNTLNQHLTAKHLDRAKQIGQMIESFTAMMIFRCFQSPEPLIMTAYEQGRAGLFDMARKNSLTDAELRSGLATFGKTAEEIQSLMPVATYLRDFLSEQGQFEHPAVKQARANAPVAA